MENQIENQMENVAPVFEGGIVFDPASGISEEEQREILARINSLGEQNRQSFSQTAGGKNEKFKARKKGGLFPVIVNIIALVLLGGGFVLLSSFQGKEDLKVREGARVYNSAERALIDEIRKETSSQIEEKEGEISLIVSKMADVDAEIQKLHSSNQELSAEQRAAEAELQHIQEEYRSNLGALQDDRSRILEAARAREAGLHAQLEARTRELNAVSEESQAALSSAQGELERLSGDQEKASAIEAQLAGYFAAVNDQIRSGRFNEAADTLTMMRAFLNTPSFQSIRSVQARKELYTQAINSMEGMVEEARKKDAALAALASGVPIPSENSEDSEKALADLQSRNAQLEETIAGLNRSIASFSSQGSNLGQRLTELESSAAALRTLNSALESSLAERESTTAALESQNVGLIQTISARESVIAAQEENIASLNSQLTSIRQALQALTQ